MAYGGNGGSARQRENISAGGISVAAAKNNGVASRKLILKISAITIVSAAA
jgi:hypothetical protein